MGTLNIKMNQTNGFDHSSNDSLESIDIIIPNIPSAREILHPVCYCTTFGQFLTHTFFRSDHLTHTYTFTQDVSPAALRGIVISMTNFLPLVPNVPQYFRTAENFRIHRVLPQGATQITDVFRR